MELVRILNRPVGDSVNAVDARELHRALEVGRDFSTWIRSRIESLELVEGTDFEKVNDSRSPVSGNGNHTGIRFAIEYVISLDAAKHIAMAERNERGRQVRAYFIEAEKKLRDPVALLDNPDVLRKLLGSYAERQIALESENRVLAERLVEAAPKVAIVDRIVDVGDTLGFRCAAKLVFEATGARETEFRTLLMTKARWVQRLDGQLMPTHVGTERGYVTVRDREWDDRDGVHHCKPELRITQKGVKRVIEIFLAGDAA